MSNNDWITTTQAASDYGYSLYHLEDLSKAGTIKAQKFGRTWMISRSSLEKHIAKMAKTGEKTGRKTQPQGT